MEETISLRELVQTLRKRLALITLITLAAVAISGTVSFFVLTPIYDASTQLLVNQSKSDQPYYNTSEIQANVQIINTYNEIIKTPAILDKVKENLGLDLTISSLNSKISVSSQNNSQVMNLTVQDPDPYLAADIANSVAEVFEKEVVSIMSVDNVTILTKAEVPENASPVKPKPMLNIAIALVIGLMVGVGVAFLLEYLDNTIKTAQDVEQHLELPVLGAIATIEDQKLERMMNTRQKSRMRSERVV